MGCRGRVVEPYERCLEHLADAERAAYLGTLAPGSSVRHEGTTFTRELLGELLTAVRDPATGRPRFGRAGFTDCGFAGDLVLNQVTFDGEARFDGAHFAAQCLLNRVVFGGRSSFHGSVFRGTARFSDVRVTGSATWTGMALDSPAEWEGVRFEGPVSFGGTEFRESVRWHDVTFAGPVDFVRARFGAEAYFERTTFAGNASFIDLGLSDFVYFRSVTFHKGAFFVKVDFPGAVVFSQVEFRRETQFTEAVFNSTTRFSYCTFLRVPEFSWVRFRDDAVFSNVVFADGARFESTTFEVTSHLGPVVCLKTLDLSGARFRGPALVTAAASEVRAHRTHWSSTATLRLRHATVDLSDAAAELPLTVAAGPAPFTALENTQAPAGSAAVRVVSIRSVDAAHLVLTDLDLSDCRFAGAVHLDQLRLEGRCVFATPPSGFRRRGTVPGRWTSRRTLAEEHHWRTARGGSGWKPAPGGDVPGPATVAPLYRQLRKSLEDGKNEPDAADFYYGEMEMRRNDPGRPGGERALLAVYWALSGYGLRASRAMGWLLAAMASTVLAMMLWGLAAQEPDPVSRGTVDGRRVQLTTRTPDPVDPSGPYARRMTGQRFEKSLRVVINSVVFRSSEQGLTTAGTYIEMTSRVTEPILLAFAALAVRSRVKR
ncbi:pentapeptide repeat-containing protein [Streptomyces sp. NPDC046977]|uniref:pentapeptide repeat-containing protein n=1 Tax=Streptomyces sp. NPDC046977 TaxID=3154703 RepID=UPI0034090AA9